MASNFNSAARSGGGRTSYLSNLSVSFQEFFRQPMLVGSAFPASQHLVDALLDPVDWTKARVVVEYGPGSGPLTRAILTRMPRDSHLLAIEISPHFTRHLRNSIHDPRLLAVTGSAASVDAILKEKGLGSADVIVTGIPFSTMSAGDADTILDASAHILGSEGHMLAYQMRPAIAPMLTQRFADVEHTRVWRNIPPCHLYWAHGPARKPAARKIL